MSWWWSLLVATLGATGHEGVLEPEPAAAGQGPSAPAPDADAGDPSGRLPLLFDVGATIRATSTSRVPRTALAFDPATGTWRTRDLYRPEPRLTYGSALISVAAEAELLAGISLRLLVDTGELRQGSSLEPPLDATITSEGDSFARTAGSGALVRELAVALAADRGSIALGRQLFRVADGLVFEDFGTGVTSRLSLARADLPITAVELDVAAVGHRFSDLSKPAPLATLRLVRDLSLFESVELYGSVFVENRGSVLRDALESALAEEIIDAQTGDPALQQSELTRLFFVDRPSSGRLYYVGAAGNAVPADGLSLHGAFTAAFGNLTISGPAQEYAFALHGYGAVLDASYGLTPLVSAGLTVLALSGDRPPGFADGSAGYGGFLAVAPYWAWTGIFFGAGLTQGLYPGRAALAGVNGRGVRGTVARLEWTGDSLTLKAKGAALWSAAGSPPRAFGGGGAFYGFELDFIGELRAASMLSLALEADALWPGSFFAEHDLGYRVLGQVHVQLGN